MTGILQFLLSFSLLFHDSTSFRLFFPHFHLVSQPYGQSNPMYATIPDTMDTIFGALTKPYLSFPAIHLILAEPELKG